MPCIHMMCCLLAGISACQGLVSEHTSSWSWKPRGGLEVSFWGGLRADGSNKGVPVREALRNIVDTGCNAYIFGPSGFGKSELIKNAFVPALRAKHGMNAVMITGSTGMASLHIDGNTVHSMAGVGRGKGTIEDIVIEMPDVARARLIRCKVIILDEISMISADFLQMLDKVFRLVRNCPDTVFGGIQMIVVGDFGQLPPVPDLINDAKSSEKEMPEAPYAFEGETWQLAAFKCYRLTHCYRCEARTSKCMLSFVGVDVVGNHGQ